MTADTLELFYAYAHENEALRTKLNKHLALLVRQKLIVPWHDQDVTAGSLWDQELRDHLASANIILLLVSSDFLASDYCYQVQVQEALKRHAAKQARVIPILLQPCDWEYAPFSTLKVLPDNRKPVTMWSDQNAAFANIAKGIRKVVNETNGTEEPSSEETTEGKKKRTKGGGGGKREMARTPTSISPVTLKRVIGEYHEKIKRYQAVADYELGLRSAFQNMLDDVAESVGWSLVPEMTIKKIRPDGVVIDDFKIRRGYWEAKGPKTNLEKEIVDKISAGYPLINTIFEDTQKAVLYQSKKRHPVTFDLNKTNDVRDLLNYFFTYVEPDIENFEEAVEEFKERIPEHAQALLDIIQEEYKLNRRFQIAFAAFSEVCIKSLDPNMSKNTINEMLVQHMLTERLFRTVFNNPDFVRRNVIAAEIEKVVDALASRSFHRGEFLKTLDRFYIAIERTAKGIETWGERQEFLNTVYERFFQGFSIKQADTHGIVYTPQEIVDFMVESVDEILKSEFGKSLETPGVKILDPATGTGNFIVNIIRRIDEFALAQKFKEDLFCNEVMLLPYYIASLNIEHEYYARMGEYASFEGICFADTLTLDDGSQPMLDMFAEENTERVKRENEADISVVIANPPYNAWQKNENDNNKNRKYEGIDRRTRETYARSSSASNKNALSDMYVKFFRWATDRLGKRDGIVCFVSNNSFVDQIAFDGMRMQLQKDFTTIYHLDLHGNVRKNPKLSGTTHNVFGIQVGVGITIAIRNSKHTERKLYYYRVPENWRKTEKATFLNKSRDIKGIDWQELQPDAKNTWVTEGLQNSFASFLAIGTKDAKGERIATLPTIFKNYGGGVKTNRDDWAYDFDKDRLTEKIRNFISFYKTEVDRWKHRGENKQSVDDFVRYEDDKIKWSEGIKANLQKGLDIEYKEEKVRNSLYRPFCRQYLYFDSLLNERTYQLPQIFPVVATEQENSVICLSGIGSSKLFHCLASRCIPDIHLTGDSQCFPYYTYSSDGTNRSENITDWALQQFQEKYGPQVTKWDIFHYVYGMLHHPQYRDLYKENLKRDLPHIPLVLNQEGFEACVSVGKQLMDMHVNYEEAEEYPLKIITNKEIPHVQRLRVEKMKLSADKKTLKYSTGLTLEGIPQECSEYRLGNRSALEWVIDQYQVSKDSRSGIESDPNRLDDPQYIVRLVKQVVTVSVKTVELVKELVEAVTAEDWLGEQAVSSVEEQVER